MSGWGQAWRSGRSPFPDYRRHVKKSALSCTEIEMTHSNIPATSNPTVDVFWSMRSSFCYLALDRLLALEAEWRVQVEIRVVYPVAIRNPEFFSRAPAHYRPYHLLDSQRVADFHGIPYRRPRPDPIVQDLATNAIADEQPYIHQLTRLAAAAQMQGRALPFLDQVMRMIWDGSVDNWHQGDHLADAITRSGMNASALLNAVRERPDEFDAVIEANQTAQASAGHSGVPLCVFDGEPFFGQDRLALLQWRLQQQGVTRR